MKKKMVARVGFIVLALILATSLLLAACEEEEPTPTPTPTEPQYGGVFKIICFHTPSVLGYPADFLGLDPYSAAPVCLEKQLKTDLEGRPVPWGCTAFEWSEDLSSVIFTVRKGVKFHDGTDWNAEALKWNMDMLKAAEQHGTQSWVSTDVLDDYHLRLNVSEYSNTLLGFLATQTGISVSPTAVQEHGKEWACLHPVGTGPFKFVSYKRDDSCKYERFDDYWGDKPYLDGVEFVYIVNPVTQAAALQVGDGDALWVRDKAVAADLRDKGYKMLVAEVFWSGLAGDSVHPDSPFADKKVRMAVEYAIDKQAICGAVGWGFTHPLYQMAVPVYAGHDPALEATGRKYDPDKARQLLAEAGYADGFKTRIIFATTDSQEPYLAIQRYLLEVGIDAKLEVVEPAKYMEYTVEGWDNGLISGGGGGDAFVHQSLQRHLHRTSLRYQAVWRPAEWDALMKESFEAVDYDLMIAKTREMVKLGFNEVIMIPLWTNPWIYAVRENVQDFDMFEWAYLFTWTPNKTWLSK